MSQLIIHTDIPVLRLTDKLAAAAIMIQDAELGGLPILKQDKLIGTLLESDVETLTDLGEKNLHRSLANFTHYPPITLNLSAHPYQAIKLFAKIKHDFLPVIDDDDIYHGSVLREELVNDFFQRFHVTDDSSLLEIEAPGNQFRMSDMIRLLEQNETTVLSISTRPSYEAEGSQIITLSVQSRDTFRLQRTLERYGYSVIFNSNPSDDIEDDLSQKAKAFMRYLEM